MATYVWPIVSQDSPLKGETVTGLAPTPRLAVQHPLQANHETLCNVKPVKPVFSASLTQSRSVSTMLKDSMVSNKNKIPI